MHRFIKFIKFIKFDSNVILFLNIYFLQFLFNCDFEIFSECYRFCWCRVAHVNWLQVAVVICLLAYGFLPQTGFEHASRLVLAQ